jgi:hypothetical protein
MRSAQPECLRAPRATGSRWASSAALRRRPTGTGTDFPVRASRPLRVVFRLLMCCMVAASTAGEGKFPGPEAVGWAGKGSSSDGSGGRKSLRATSRRARSRHGCPSARCRSIMAPGVNRVPRARARRSRSYDPGGSSRGRTSRFRSRACRASGEWAIMPVRRRSAGRFRPKRSSARSRAMAGIRAVPMGGVPAGGSSRGRTLSPLLGRRSAREPSSAFVINCCSNSTAASASRSQAGREDRSSPAVSTGSILGRLVGGPAKCPGHSSVAARRLLIRGIGRSKAGARPAGRIHEAHDRRFDQCLIEGTGIGPAERLANPP